MPSKPRTLAGILRLRRHADAEYNRARRSGPDRSVEDAVVSSARWKALRARILRDEPLCRACTAAGRTELATQVDHVVPVRVRPDLAYDVGNCQPLCGPCHGAKTAAERRSGGVGGTSTSHASGAYGGARGASQFSRVSPPAVSAPPDCPGRPVDPALAGDQGAQAGPTGAPPVEDAQTPARPQERAPTGDSAPSVRCDAKPALSGGISPPGTPLSGGVTPPERPLSPRDIDAMAVGVALTHGLPLEAVRARIEAALARGERVLEFP